MKFHIHLILSLALFSVSCADTEQPQVKKNTGETVTEPAATTPTAPAPETTTPAPSDNDPMEAACTSFCNQFSSCLTGLGCGQLAGPMDQCVSNCLTQYTIDQAPHIANITCDAVNTQVCNGPQATEVQAQCACEPFINQGECNDGLTCYSITGGAVCLDLSSTTGVPADAASCASPDDCEEGQACITLQAGGNFCVSEC